MLLRLSARIEWPPALFLGEGAVGVLALLGKKKNCDGKPLVIAPVAGCRFSYLLQKKKKSEADCCFSPVFHVQNNSTTTRTPFVTSTLLQRSSVVAEREDVTPQVGEGTTIYMSRAREVADLRPLKAFFLFRSCSTPPFGNQSGAQPVQQLFRVKWSWSGHGLIMVWS